MKNAKGTAPAAPRATQRATPGDLDEIIATHPFLKGLNPHQTRILRDCAMITQFKAGELVFREGDPANRFYLILQGKVALEAHTQDRGVTPIQFVESGEVLGWSWLFPPYYWHFDARALEDTDAVFFYGAPLREECDSDHDFGYEMFKRISTVIVNRLHSTRRQLVSVTIGKK